jgi:single-strand DNA-binding protein
VTGLATCDEFVPVDRKGHVLFTKRLGLPCSELNPIDREHPLPAKNGDTIMMRTQITIVGYLGQDPKSNQVGDHTVVNFSVAANRKVKGNDVTDWFNIATWGKLGELCHRYLSKGRQVIVAGTFEPRTYEKDGETRTSFDVRANEVHFIGKGSDEDRPASTPAGDGDLSAQNDDSIPF